MEPTNCLGLDERKCMNLVSDVAQVVDLFGFQPLVDLVSSVVFLVMLLTYDDGSRDGHPAFRYDQLFAVVSTFVLQSGNRKK